MQSEKGERGKAWFMRLIFHLDSVSMAPPFQFICNLVLIAYGAYDCCASVP